jgi:hypothetical protein
MLSQIQPILTIVKLSVAVRAKSNGICDCVCAMVSELPDMMNFKEWSSI